MELGIPMVLALNMMDEVRKSGKKIDTAKLSQLLGIPVVETVARSGEGKQTLIETALGQIRENNGRWKPLEILLRTRYRPGPPGDDRPHPSGRVPDRQLSLPVARPQIPRRRRPDQGPGRPRGRHRRHPGAHDPAGGRALPGDPRHQPRGHHRGLPLRLHRRRHPAGGLYPARPPGADHIIRQDRPGPDPPLYRPPAHDQRALRDVHRHLHGGGGTHGLARSLLRLAGRGRNPTDAAGGPPVHARGRHHRRGRRRARLRAAHHGHVSGHRLPGGFGIHGPDGLHDGPGAPDLRPPRMLGHALHRGRRHSRWMRGARRHGRPDPEKPKGEAGHPAHGAFHAVRREGTGLPPPGRGLFQGISPPRSSSGSPSAPGRPPSWSPGCCATP